MRLFGSATIVSWCIAACGEQAPPTVVFTANGRPTLVVARLNDLPFEILMPEQVGDVDWSYRIPSYEVIDLLVACGSPPASAELRATAATDFSLLRTLNCGALEPASEELTVIVDDDNNLPKYLRVSNAEDQNDASEWTSTLMAYKPRADVIAFDQNKIAIVRDIDTSHGSTDLDVNIAAGNSLQTGMFSFGPVDEDERLLNLTLLTTRNGTIATWPTAPGVYVSFSSGLAAGDFRNTTIVASSSTNEVLGTAGHRSLSYYTLDDASESFPGQWTWMPRLPDMKLSDSKTSATLPVISFSYTSSQLECSSTDGRLEQIIETYEWEALHNPVDITFDESSPGWSSDWEPTSDGRQCDFVMANDFTEGEFTTEYEWLSM